MKILAFGASNSKKSINRQLAAYTASLVTGAEVDLLDLNDLEMPIYSEDIEAELGGQPPQAQVFIDRIAAADALIISFAEHNGSYSAAYKNIFDWATRINGKLFLAKPVLLLSTSPGPGGAASVLAFATNSMQFFDGKVSASISVPSFYDNFDAENGVISNPEIKEQLLKAAEALLA